MTKKQNKHIAKIIERELGFTNGWRIDDKNYTEHCLKAAKKIDSYLRNGLKISSKRVVIKPLPSDELFDFIIWTLTKGWRKYPKPDTFYRVINQRYHYKTQAELYEDFKERGNVL